MLRSLAKAAGFLAYLFITLEMLFMDSIRSVLLLGLQPAARGVFESSGYGVAASLLFASSFD
jgi:hypothetical protein